MEWEGGPPSLCVKIPSPAQIETSCQTRTVLSELPVWTKKYAYLLEDEDVRRWHRNLANGSVLYAIMCLKAIGRFSTKIGSSPKEYAALPVEKMEDIAQDYINHLQSKLNPRTKRNYAPGYIENNLDAIRNWSAWNRKKFLRAIRIPYTDSTPTLDNEIIPTPLELRRVMYADTTNLRTRVSIAIMAFSGCRPQVQGNFLGTDGLKLKDLPELSVNLDERKVSFGAVPTMVIVRENLSKMGRQYFTFFPQEGCDLLKLYLERRMIQGEKLSPSSPVIATSQLESKQHLNLEAKAALDNSPFIITPQVSKYIKRAITRAGMDARPYVNRSYFDTNLMLAESQGMISHAYQQFFMGHKGDIERTYTIGKKRLPQNVLDDMRERFRKVAEKFLETTPSIKGVSEAEMIETYNRKSLMGAGYTEEEIKALVPNLAEISDEELSRLMQEKADSRAKQRLGLNSNGKQKVVNMTDVETWIEQGWQMKSDYVNVKGVRKAIIYFPHNG
jgi:hypothetical protein